MSIIIQEFELDETCCREEGDSALDLPAARFRLIRPLTQAEGEQIGLLQEQLGDLANIEWIDDFNLECTAHCTPFIRAWLNSLN